MQIGISEGSRVLIPALSGSDDGFGPIPGFPPKGSSYKSPESLIALFLTPLDGRVRPLNNTMRVTMRVTIFIVYCRIHVVVYLDGKSERRMTPGRYGRRQFLTLKKRTQITTQYQPRQGGAQKNIFFKNGEKPRIRKPME